MLEYNRNRVTLAALCCMFGMVLFGAVYVDPEIIRGSRRMYRALGSGFGHDVIVPVFFLMSALGSFLLIRLGLGDCAAVRADQSGLVVNNKWSRRRIPWADLIGVEGRYRTVYKTQHPLLVFMVKGPAGPNEVKLDVSMVQLPGGDVHEAAEQIRRLRPAGAAGTVQPPSRAHAAAAGFDPDDAIARYLASRPDEPAPAVAEAIARPNGPRRASFGRKAV